MTTNFKVMRVKAGIRQDKAAEALEITPQTLYNYENGKSDPPWTKVSKMAALYGCSITDFEDEPQ